MSPEEIESIKDILLTQRAELEGVAQSSNEAARTVELDQAAVGRLSRMDAIRAQEMALEANRRRAGQLARIEGALRRIKAGDFGCCYVCGEEIDIRRLRIDPTATRCLACTEA